MVPDLQYNVSVLTAAVFKVSFVFIGIILLSLVCLLQVGDSVLEIRLGADGASMDVLLNNVTQTTELDAVDEFVEVPSKLATIYRSETNAFKIHFTAGLIAVVRSPSSGHSQGYSFNILQIHFEVNDMLSLKLYASEMFNDTNKGLLGSLDGMNMLTSRDGASSLTVTNETTEAQVFPIANSCNMHCSYS
jgi:hypothetical protein